MQYMIDPVDMPSFYMWDISPLLDSINSLSLSLSLSGPAAQRGLWPPRQPGFVITHYDAPQSVGLLWTSDQLVAETST
jgi:hypothetical protein